MSSFFLPASRSSSRGKKHLRDKHEKKKLKSVRAAKSASKSARKPISELNEEIHSDSDGEQESGRKRSGRETFFMGSDSEDDHETAPEKKLRLAKEYLAQLEQTELEEVESEEAHRAAIAHRLRDDVLEHAGKLQRKVAEEYSAPNVDHIRKLKGHQLSVTCVAMTPDDRFIFSGSKDCCIIKWSIETGKKVVIFPGHRKGIEGVVCHSGHVQALAVSSDSKFLASGGGDKVVHVWDAVLHLHLHTFKGHKDTITGLVFQAGSHQLFSCSADRTVKIWNLDEMAYVETLFGHQDGISSMDCLQRERPVTAGSSDQTLRVWKVVEESQLVFNGHKSSIDAVKMINEDHMISGSQDGTVALWNVMKKKPLVCRSHHLQCNGAPSVTREFFVTSVAALTNSDLVASGSSDGLVVAWKCGENYRSMEPLFSFHLNGFVNSLMFSGGGEWLVAGVGQEHRFGRWWKEAGSKNRVVIVPLNNL